MSDKEPTMGETNPCGRCCWPEDCADGCIKPPSTPEPQTEGPTLPLSDEEWLAEWRDGPVAEYETYARLIGMIDAKDAEIARWKRLVFDVKDDATAEWERMTAKVAAAEEKVARLTSERDESRRVASGINEAYMQAERTVVSLQREVESLHRDPCPACAAAEEKVAALEARESKLMDEYQTLAKGWRALKRENDDYERREADWRANEMDRTPIAGWVWCEAETDGTVTREGRMCHTTGEGWDHCDGPHHSLYIGTWTAPRLAAAEEKLRLTDVLLAWIRDQYPHTWIYLEDSEDGEPQWHHWALNDSAHDSSSPDYLDYTVENCERCLFELWWKEQQNA